MHHQFCWQLSSIVNALMKNGGQMKILQNRGFFWYELYADMCVPYVCYMINILLIKIVSNQDFDFKVYFTDLCFAIISCFFSHFFLK